MHRAIPKLYKSKYYSDNRGFLIKNSSTEKNSFSQNFRDTYISISNKNVFRGFHYQKKPFLQEKFFTIVKGEIDLYCLNINNFDEYFRFSMTPEKGLSLYVPRGWATGIHSLDKESIVFYSSNQIYKSECQITINYRVVKCLRDKEFIISKNDS